MGVRLIRISVGTTLPDRRGNGSALHGSHGQAPSRPHPAPGQSQASGDRFREGSRRSPDSAGQPTAAVSTASASTINGGYVFDGVRMKHGTSKSSIITKGNRMKIKREELLSGRIDLRISPLARGFRPFILGAGHQGAALARQRHRPWSAGNNHGHSFATRQVFRNNAGVLDQPAGRYDLEVAEKTLRRRIEREISPRAA